MPELARIILQQVALELASMAIRFLESKLNSNASKPSGT
jgi:hypothetical protein